MRVYQKKKHWHLSQVFKDSYRAAQYHRGRLHRRNFWYAAPLFLPYLFSSAHSQTRLRFHPSTKIHKYVSPWFACMHSLSHISSPTSPFFIFLTSSMQLFNFKRSPLTAGATAINEGYYTTLVSSGFRFGMSRFPFHNRFSRFFHFIHSRYVHLDSCINFNNRMLSNRRRTSAKAWRPEYTGSYSSVVSIIWGGRRWGREWGKGGGI